MGETNYKTELNCAVNPNILLLHCIFEDHNDQLIKLIIFMSKLFSVRGLLPIVVEVIEARRPRIQENGNDIAMALDFILLSCKMNFFSQDKKLY